MQRLLYHKMCNLNSGRQDEESLYIIKQDSAKELIFKTKRGNKDSGDIKVQLNNRY